MSHAAQARKRAYEHACGIEEPEYTTCAKCGESFAYSIHQHTDADDGGYFVCVPSLCAECADGAS